MNEGNYGSTFNPRRREKSRSGPQTQHSTDWMVEVGPSVEWRRRVVALEHAIQGDNDDDKKR